jgi:hypothetical protein
MLRVWLLLKRQKLTSVDKDAKLLPLAHGRNVRTAIMKVSMEVLQKIKVDLP